MFARLCEKMPLFASQFFLAELLLSTQPGNSSSRWFEKSFFTQFQGLLSESLSYIMFFHTSAVFTDTKRLDVLQGRVCFVFFLFSPSSCLSSKIFTLALLFPHPHFLTVPLPNTSIMRHTYSRFVFWVCMCLCKLAACV